MQKKAIIMIAIISLSLLVVYSLSMYLLKPKVGDLRDSKSSFQTYENPVYGIKISYPSQWQEFQVTRGNMIVGFVSYPQDESGILDNVIVQTVEPSYTSYPLRIIAEKELSMYKSQLDKFLVHSLTSNVTSLGLPIYKMEYSHLKDKLQIKTMEILVENRNHIYRILFNSDASEYSQFVPQVENMIDSLIIDHQAPPKQSITKYHGNDFFSHV